MRCCTIMRLIQGCILAVRDICYIIFYSLPQSGYSIFKTSSTFFRYLDQNATIY